MLTLVCQLRVQIECALLVLPSFLGSQVLVFKPFLLTWRAMGCGSSQQRPTPAGLPAVSVQPTCIAATGTDAKTVAVVLPGGYTHLIQPNEKYHYHILEIRQNWKLFSEDENVLVNSVKLSQAVLSFNIWQLTVGLVGFTGHARIALRKKNGLC